MHPALMVVNGQTFSAIDIVKLNNKTIKITETLMLSYTELVFNRAYTLSYNNLIEQSFKLCDFVSGYHGESGELYCKPFVIVNT